MLQYNRNQKWSKVRRHTSFYTRYLLLLYFYPFYYFFPKLHVLLITLSFYDKIIKYALNVKILYYNKVFIKIQYVLGIYPIYFEPLRPLIALRYRQDFYDNNLQS